MARKNFIKLYVNEQEEEDIKKSALDEGYLSVSAFLRDLALNKNTLFKERFFEIYNKIMQK